MSTLGAPQEPVRLGLLQRNALIVGAALLILATLVAFVPSMRASFFRAYLIGFEFCLSVTLGCMVVMMIRHLTGGAWGLYLRPILEAGAALVPVTGVLFLPILIGLPDLYRWNSDPNGAHLPPHQAEWFNLTFFVLRAVFYFAVWTVFAVILNAGPRQANVPPFDEPPRRFRAVSAIGIGAYGLTITAAAIDWSLSLDLPWFSTIYGAMYAGGQLLAGFAFAVLFASLLFHGAPTQLLRDFGNLLLAFTMIWAYLSFSQFLLIWAGNLPEETAYFRPRFDDGWQWVVLLILLGQFAAPFFLLLLKRVKMSGRTLAFVAGLSLAMHYVDLVWLTLPAFGDNSWVLLFLSPAVLVGLAGVWLSLFLWRLQRRPFQTVGLAPEAPSHE